MARVNTAVKTNIETHEGGKAANINVEQQLRRSVLSCLLWEDQFYESGQEIGKRIVELAEKVPPAKLAALAIEARKVHNLRHVSLLLLNVLCKTGSGSRLVSDTIYEVVSRADELSELLALYWKDGKRPLSAQLKKGLGRAFTKFDAYQLAKYNRDNPVKLRDVLFLTHAKPNGNEEIFKALAEKTLTSPDTWEVALSGGADKKETFERLIKDGKLGYMALLRNLRNMVNAGVDRELIESALRARKGADRVLPFRFISAARAAPQLEPVIDEALIASIDGLPKLPGITIVLVDVSSSMEAKLSGKSDLSRADAACALASVINGNLRVFSFSGVDPMELPPRKGMAGVDSIKSSQRCTGTDIGRAVTFINKLPHDRLIMITDEQSNSRVPDPMAKHAYVINVASYKNGIGYGRWTHIDGFSENVIKFIVQSEVD